MEYNGSSALAHVPCLIIRKHKWLEYNSISLIKCRCLSTSLLTVFKNSFLFLKTVFCSLKQKKIKKHT